MPPVPTSFDVLVNGDRVALQSGTEPTALRIGQQCPRYRRLQALAKCSQQFPCSVAGVVTLAEFSTQCWRQNELCVFLRKPAIEARQLDVQQGFQPVVG